MFWLTPPWSSAVGMAQRQEVETIGAVRVDYPDKAPVCAEGLGNPNRSQSVVLHISQALLVDSDTSEVARNRA